MRGQVSSRWSASFPLPTLERDPPKFRSTMKSEDSELCVPHRSRDPKLLRINVRAHNGVSRKRAYHRLQFRADAVLFRIARRKKRSLDRPTCYCAIVITCGRIMPALLYGSSPTAMHISSPCRCHTTCFSTQSPAPILHLFDKHLGEWVPNVRRLTVLV